MKLTEISRVKTHNTIISVIPSHQVRMLLFSCTHEIKVMNFTHNFTYTLHKGEKIPNQVKIKNVTKSKLCEDLFKY